MLSAGDALIAVDRQEVTMTSVLSTLGGDRLAATSHDIDLGWLAAGALFLAVVLAEAAVILLAGVDLDAAMRLYIVT
jgi:hypothetical protein